MGHNVPTGQMSGHPALGPGSATARFYDFGHVTYPLCASVLLGNGSRRVTAAMGAGTSGTEAGKPAEVKARAAAIKASPLYPEPMGL